MISQKFEKKVTINQKNHVWIVNQDDPHVND